MSLIRTWAPFFRSSVRVHGKAYYQARRVEQLAPEGDELLRTRVRGTNDYIVTIRGQGASATVQCTCPVFASGSYCKHIWATLLHVHHQGLEQPSSAASPLDGAPPPPPKARKRSPGQSMTKSSEPEWVGRLSLMRPPIVGVDAPPPLVVPQRQVCYVVCPDLSTRYHGLVVELRQRQPIRAGWSTFKPLRINSTFLAELPDPADRELCALLLGAGEVSTDGDRYFPEDRMRSAFQVLAGASRAMLKRMIATGRCFIDTGESLGAGTPEKLTWDGEPAEPQPWIPWLVGLDTGDGLALNLELRRGENRMGVDRPALVLGGIDGLVFYDHQAAPLDDRGAMRWINQYRDDLRRRDDSAVIRVPQRDVSRFLARLYRLPALPEVELPEGVGLAERHVVPVPHMDLHSPGVGILADPSQPRQMLTARVWFAYDQHRVDPAQPGRFVHTANDDQALEALEAAAGPADAEASEDDLDEELAELVEQAEDQAPDEDEDLGGGGDDTTAQMPSDPALALVPPETLDSLAPPDGVAMDLPPLDATADATPADDAAASIPAAGAPVLMRRDRRNELEATSGLLDIGFRTGGNGSTHLLLPLKLMPSAVSSLLARGWVVSADRRVVRGPGSSNLSIASGIDWFEVRGGIRYGEGDQAQTISLPAILAAARDGRTMIELGDGSQGILPYQWLAEHGLLAAIGQVEGDSLRFRASQAALLDALLSQQELVDVDAQFDAARRRLREFQGVLPVDPAASFKGSLRPYQREGLGWMAFLRQFGMGGILADDMGLGKTIQVLAMLDGRYAAAREAGQTLAPTLIVVPRSVVFNWIDEATRFTPALRVAAYAGADRQAQRETFADHDIIVTSYGLMRRDVAELRKITFDYVVLDEAQAIKNPASQGAKAARLLEANHRLALTGTPVENHLGDLWSIFEFLNPGMLGSSTTFAEMIRGGLTGASVGDDDDDAGPPPDALNANGRPTRARTASLSAAAAHQLGQALRPFILRRTKKQVLTELPEKTEQTILCVMEPEQRAVYDQLLRHYRGTLLGQLDQQGVATHGSLPTAPGGTGMGKSAMMVLEALLRLRQAACHPALIDPARTDLPSAKLDVLTQRITDLIEEGHKALIFSQFTSMLALVRRDLDARNVPYEYLDGQTRHRRQHVQRFQTDPDCRLFLISLKAGGLGLNLTAAEYVFILDPWWNPAVENQAIDRAHRIGQTRHVFAYRLICEDTVEQRIAELQERKKQLADAIIGGQESLLRALTREDLERLLS